MRKSSASKISATASRTKARSQTGGARPRKSSSSSSPARSLKPKPTIVLPTPETLSAAGLDASGHKLTRSTWGFRELAIGERKPLGSLEPDALKRLKRALERHHTRHPSERVALLYQDDNHVTAWRLR